MAVTASVTPVQPVEPGSWDWEAGAGKTDQSSKQMSPARLFGFTDPDTIKTKVRESLAKPEHHGVEIYYKDKGLAQEIARHAIFEQVTLGVIALNAVYMAVDTDWNKEKPMESMDTKDLQDAAPFFFIMENLFCTYFTVELVVRFLAFKNKMNCFRNAWFMFDSVLVIMMVLETWVLLIIIEISGSSGDNPLGGTGFLRLFRLLRLTRLIRMLRSLPELMILIKGMVTAMTSVFYVMCLLVIITYVFAIAFTQMSVDTETIGEAYFKNVPLSMYSLLVYGTFLDNLSDFCNDIRMEEGKEYLLGLAILFICLAALTVMNMLIGVLCEVVSAVAKTEKEEILTSSVSEQMLKVASSLDINSDKVVSYAEFTKIIEKPEALRALQDVGVSPVGLLDFAEFFFFEEGKPTELPFQKFMDMVLDLRESNTATVKDMLDVWRKIKSTTNADIQQMKENLNLLDTKIDQRTQGVEAQLATILSEVQSLTGLIC